MGAARHYKKPEIDLITALAAEGLSPEEIVRRLVAAGHLPRPARSISTFPGFAAGRRVYAQRVERERVEARLAAEQRRRESAARFWRHPEYPSVSLPRLSILDGKPA